VHRQPTALLIFRFCLVLAVLGLSMPAVAQTIVTSTHADPAPAEIAEPLRALLADGGARAQSGESILTFWWVKSLAVFGAPEWEKVAEGSLVGAVQIGALFRDIRGRTIKPGVYTLRYAIQPQDGDHLGVSTFRDYLLLIPAALDQAPAPPGHVETVRLSTRTIGASHPGPWMLNPPTTTEPALSTGTNDMKLQYVVFEVQTTAGPMRFGLVIVGKVEA
jgi:hypothetical protein